MLTTGQLAERACVTADTVRYYERTGLLPKARRSRAGYRLFPEGALHRIRLVRNASQFGFTLQEIASFLRVRDEGGAPCREVREGAARLLEDVDRRVGELAQIRERMRRVLAEWDELLARAPSGTPVYLLAALDEETLDPGVDFRP